MLEYIKELLSKLNRLTIPDLGTFLVKDKAGGEGKEIYFNDFLKFNDGVLAEYIAKEEKIPKLDAEGQVTAWVDDVHKKLEEGEEIFIYNVGILVKNGKGNITLSTSKDVLAEKKKEEKKVELRKEEKKYNQKEESSVEQPIKESKQEEIHKTQTKMEKAKKENTEAAKKEQPQADKPQEAKKSKKKTVLILIGVVVALIIVFGVLNRENFKEYFGKKEVVSEPVVVEEVVDTVATNHIEPVEEVIVEEVEEVVEEPDYLSFQHHVIGGSFQNEVYANEFIEYLQEQGYPNARIVASTGGFHMVCFNSYETKREAVNEMKSFMDGGTQAWYMFY